MKKKAFLILIGLCLLALPVHAQINLLHNFAQLTTDGAEPQGSLILSGTTLYGMTKDGGHTYSYGTIFKIETNGTGYALLHTFSWTDGDEPLGSLVLSGTTLYGMTKSGGASGMGTIFKIETNGTGFTVLRSFVGGTDDGAYPYGSLILGGSTLYGMTTFGGHNDFDAGGTIFKIGTDGSGYSILKIFYGGAADGSMPQRNSLLLSGETLYGMTTEGGPANNQGTIFKINTDGSQFALLHTFARVNDNGAYPYGSLILDGSTLYGMTYAGGSVDGGTIFKLGIDGSGFTLLHRFLGGAADGAGPYGDLLLSGSTLYGMTSSGGSGYGGTIFKMGISGSDFALGHKFAGTPDDGSSPRGSLILSGSTLYGMTPSGGNDYVGVIFSLPVFSIISGTITMEGSPLSGVVMSGLPGSPVTNASGVYSGTVTYGWSGTVTPTLAGYTFSPVNLVYTNVTADQTAQDYSANPAPATIHVSPPCLNFGYVRPGSYKDLTLVVKNIGGGILTGTVSAIAPFSIVSGENYSLGANQSQQIVVRYTAPLQEGSQTASLSFTGGSGITVQVKGTNKNAGLPWLMLLLD